MLRTRNVEPDPKLDVIEIEIIRCRLQAICDEMGIALLRTSMSPVISEIRDYSCGICAPDGQLIAQTNGITAFTGIFSHIVRSVLRRHGSTIMPGDIFVTNDPYSGSTHTADVVVIKPVFYEAQLAAFAAVVAHWTELGGSVAGSLSPRATEIFQEGLRMANLRIYREGLRQDDVFELIALNVRMPLMSLGDLNAQIAGARIGDLRMQETCEVYGPARMRGAFHEILAAGELASRRAIATFAEGTYSAQDWIDGDGVSPEAIEVRVSITIKHDMIVFDFGGSSAQRAAPLNCTIGALEAAVKTVFKAIIDPGGQTNDGWFRAIRIEVPRGTIFSAEFPAPTGWYFEVTAHACDLVWKALAPIAKSVVSAGSYLSLCATYIGGTEPDSGAPFVLVEPHAGGWGATDQADGENALIAMTDGETYNYSIEMFEAKFPFRIREYRLNIAGGSGAGEMRGGLGVVREYECLTDNAFMFASLGRTAHRPWGLDGGSAGTLNSIELIRGDRVESFGRLPFAELRRGDRFRVLTGGGGGFGSPSKRSPDRIAEDLREGYIDARTAAADYRGLRAEPEGRASDETGSVEGR
jgi:N-methylhydantoinase B